jgi:hypothetical protein
MRMSATKLLSLLSLGLKEKFSVTTYVFSMDMCSILKNTDMEERYTIMMFVLRDQLVVS